MIASFTIIFAGLGTLAILSFLIKENPFYRAFEYLFIGVAAGYLPLVTIKNFLWPQIVQPMFASSIIILPDGTLSEPYHPWQLLYLLPMSIGLGYYFLYVPKYRWIAGWVIAFTVGASAGLGFQGFFAEVAPQIISSFRPLYVAEAGKIDCVKSFNNLLFLSILLSTMYYFFFTFRRSAYGVSSYITRYGRGWMMICFGAFFGSTIMARLSLLIERLQFLLSVWYPEMLKVWSMIHGSH